MKVSGFSIIEFMISISLGALLITAMVGVYISNKTSSQIQQGLVKIQENGRFISHILSESIRMAGYQGCSSQDHVTLNNLAITSASTPIYEASHKLEFDKPIYGYANTASNTWSPSLPASLNGIIKDGSDVLIVRLASSNSSQLASNMSTVSGTIPLADNSLSLANGDTVIISDCSVGDIFVISSVTSASGTHNLSHTDSDNTSDTLSKAYQTDAKVMKYQYYAYMIRDTGRKNSKGSPINGLFRMKYDSESNTLSQSDEIAEGVEGMKISYGIDSDNDNNADSYQTANNISIANWPNVVSVSIKVLLDSVEDVTSSQEIYSFNGAETKASDYRMRREWNTFISLRNKAL